MVSLRTRAEARLARLRRQGWRGLLTIQPDTLLRIVKATVASAVAWEVAALLNSPRPVLASLGAILVVQVTVRATLARTIQLTIGVAVGLAIATAIGHLLGIHWWTIGLIVLGGLVIGELMRLGAFSSQVAVSALLAYTLGSGYGWLRTVDTVVGAAIGALINAAVPPPSHVSASARSLRGIAEDLGALLADVAAGLQRGLDAGAVDRWLDRARDGGASLRRAYDEMSSAEESLRFNHRGRSEIENLQRMGEARRALEHASNQVRGMIRTLLEAAESRSTTEAGTGIFGNLSPMLRSAAGAVASFGRLQAAPRSLADREQAVASAITARTEIAALNERLLGLDIQDPAQATVARLLSSLLVDSERLVREVDVQDGGAHVSAVTA